MESRDTKVELDVVNTYEEAIAHGYYVAHCNETDIICEVKCQNCRNFH